MSTGTSIWAAAAANHLADAQIKPLHQHNTPGFNFEVVELNDSLWVTAQLTKKSKIAFRTAYSPDGYLNIDVTENQDGLIINLKGLTGNYNVLISWPVNNESILHYTVKYKPANDTFIPFWPRDIVIIGDKGNVNETTGEIHVSQTGGRSGLIYASFKQPKAGSFLYFQNLTALETYNVDTETPATDVVGGQWPELGLSLPPAINKPLQAGKEYTLSDAFVLLSDKAPSNQFELSKNFLDAIADLYLLIPKPDTKYHDYPGILQNAINDLQNNKGCWSHRSGHPYINAYVCDYNTPPEIMVQLAVLLPITEYTEWSGIKSQMETNIKDALPAFYDKKIGTVMRWLPSEEHMLDESEEQKVPLVMDAWYLHHPLLNLARLASAGDKLAKDLLLKSVDYAIKVAHHFNYVWPVFYKMDTLEVIKAEAKEGAGGEKDVAGIYAHVMLQIWELTGDKKYFHEAEKAAESMLQHGFDVFYQANNTMFGAKAMMLLYRETKKEIYRDLSYLFLANIFKNIALWECNYGYGQYFPSFFKLYPLSDAPYVAVYEEQEAYSGVHEYLSYAEGLDILPSVSLLLAEFVKYMVGRAVYYYPPMLPKEMLSTEVKTGELDPDLWIALEDIHDGWEQSGSVGQEVYGAGLAFGIVPRQYINVKDENCLVFIDYPISDKTEKKSSVSFKVLGDKQLTCRICIVPKDESRLPKFTVEVENEEDQGVINKANRNKKGFEYMIHGDQKVTISWHSN
ncbi:hypothetical protein FPZ43_03555 [Mucilaginibacter pallidiroseus]|uniref:Uncharacterized protein n=1 Tax=Mucilaginibacter pallidiroseus TaxID=2599295 RepID=A0A563UJP5_9SPHI|nr:hypothetical protein [Mucilaginibacter pallidiroseus]TWR31561.1 hypothetical protein FPZ43_03555 [Mucilaginibacter pallidiroseus]